MLGSIQLAIAIFIVGFSQEKAEHRSQSDSYQKTSDSFLRHCALPVSRSAIVVGTNVRKKAVVFVADLVQRCIPDNLHLFCHVGIGGKRLIPSTLRQGPDPRCRIGTGKVYRLPITRLLL